MTNNLSNTASLSTFSRGPPLNVTWKFPAPHTLSPGASDAPSPVPARTNITFRAGSTLTTGRHWHNTHTEYIQVTLGAAIVTVNNVSNVYTAADGPVMVPRKARHEWMRWDCPERKGHQLAAQNAFRKSLTSEEANEMQEEDLNVTEWTDPMDGHKEIFFRNLFSAMQEPSFETRYPVVPGEWLRTLQIFVIMWELDNPLVLLDLSGDEKAGRSQWACAKVEEVVTWLAMGAIWLIGMKIFGLKGVNRVWTPEWLIEIWEKPSAQRTKID